MILVLLTEKEAKGQKCGFECWDKNKHRMGTCGANAVGIAKSEKKYLCPDCLQRAAAFGQNVECRVLTLVNDKIVESPISKKDFVIEVGNRKP